MQTSAPIFKDLANQHLADKELTTNVAKLTGYIYGFANGTNMRWGKAGKILSTEDNPAGYFQIMPRTTDDGFFDWYCDHREDMQFFERKEHAVLHFWYYRMEWEGLGNPKTINRN